jgi:hypothetical protein
MFSGKFKMSFNRSWLVAGILGAMVLLIIVSDEFSGTAQALSGCSTANFSAPASFPTGQNSESVAIGDFNKDGKPDLVVANSYFFTSDVSLLLGDGTGSFGTAKHFSVGREPVFVVVGDFNGDQNLDFATANSFIDHKTPSALSTVSVRLGDGKGDFGPPINSPTGSAPSCLAVGDFNHDGRLDLAVGTTGYAEINEGPFVLHPGVVSILLGDGTGGFSQSQTIELGQLSVLSIAAGDLNSDGNLDLAVGFRPALFSSGSTPRISILLGNGAGTFTETQNFTPASFPACVLLGDFNHDGKLDLVNVDDTGSGQFFNTITIRLGNGTGSFGSATSFPIDSGPKFVAAGDFNLDGNLDLVVANGHAYVTLGDGNGGFGPATDYAAFFNRVAVGDLNNDGKLDLALTLADMPDGSQSNASILLNTCTAPQLLALEQSNRAVALDSVTMVRDPFPFTPTTDFSTDQRTRIILFAMNIDLQPGENAASVTVHAENSQHAIVSIPAEYVGKVPNLSWLTQVNVRLPDELANGGDVSMSVVYHGVETSKLLITIKPPAN